jgi:hypothetical protein
MERSRLKDRFEVRDRSDDNMQSEPQIGSSHMDARRYNVGARGLF